MTAAASPLSAPLEALPCPPQIIESAMLVLSVLLANSLIVRGSSHWLQVRGCGVPRL